MGGVVFRIKLHVRCFLQDHLSPLHFMCRLMDAGMHAPIAAKICYYYEKVYRISGLS